jgi:hypothetical protein
VRPVGAGEQCRDGPGFWKPNSESGSDFDYLKQQARSLLLHLSRLTWHALGMESQPEDPTATRPEATADWKRMTGSLPTPPRAQDRDDLLWQELTVQFGWYERTATASRLAYQVLKMTALAAGAAVTVLAAISAPAALTACVAGAIVVMEGAQQMFQFH